MITNETRIIDLTVAELQAIIGKTVKSNLPSPAHAQEQLPDLLDVKGASLLLGISIDGIYGKIFDKSIPHIKRKGVKKIYFSRAALLSWLSEGEQKTRKQIKEEAKEAQIKK